ncbi:MAG: hypothetical protein ABI539_08215 [Acidobacteriota bacterium]
MRKRNAPRPRMTADSAARSTEISWQYLVLLLICGSVFAAGFFFAARQHFLSMDYGFKNSKLKKQLEDLEAEQRRLTLEREVSLSPTAIRKATRMLAGYKDQGDEMPTAAVVQTVAKGLAPQAIPVSLRLPIKATVMSKISAAKISEPEVKARQDNSENHARNGATRERLAPEKMTAVAKLR